MPKTEPPPVIPVNEPPKAEPPRVEAPPVEQPKIEPPHMEPPIFEPPSINDVDKDQKESKKGLPDFPNVPK